MPYGVSFPTRTFDMSGGHREHSINNKPCLKNENRGQINQKFQNVL
jgi:hypothetical protein